jgi:hypothetical protein
VWSVWTPGLGGDYAHVLEETIGSKRDDRTGEVWLRGCVKYLLLRQQKTQHPSRTFPH